MRVVFDSQAFRLEPHGGVSRYVALLARSLVDLQDDVDVHLVTPVHHNAYLRELTSIPQYGFFTNKPVLHPRFERVLNSLLEPALLRIARPDILHATFYRGLSNGGANARVLTVHDMIHERFVHWHPSEPIMAMKAKAVETADHIICISKSTQHDLCELLGVPLEKTSVVYHGANLLPSPSACTSVYAGSQFEGPLSRPYVLFVGQRHRHKNFEVLLKAFSISEYLRKNLRILAFGGKPFSSAELTEARRCGLSPDSMIRVTGADDLLALCYSRAQALVYPSWYEGFGAPLLEAMALRCPVLASSSSCLPEIAGDAALFFPPDAPQELAAVLEQVLTSPGLRIQLIDKGLKRQAEFSWRKCAQETLAVYRKVLK